MYDLGFMISDVLARIEPSFFKSEIINPKSEIPCC
jgi:hypothetical protein